ncbi:MAG TPA: phosphotransferase [Stackebrandtia sp.]|jgi:aminoglycoside phosphotransferase (APT) family kinase protein|uniref:phosphotransferase family protein n=1 Tax=Stackebrandtia sp. TaxID=2023065 RepID=UPI002D62ACA0|nr:phosphotransferase [Stackebrandtia sp.]HZE41690.1 phosphotransferase [Stackebrandtia sp.]
MRAKDADAPAPRLPGGYCNDTVRVDDTVVKRFTGPGAELRRDTEGRALKAAAGTVPVPRVLRTGGAELVCQFVDGTHGQRLLNPERAAGILAECGRVLAALHTVSVAPLGGADGSPKVLVHGDYGPQNLLLDEETLRVTAVLDWEWSHIGRPIEDLAWCEWIVRTHHADCVDALPHLFHGYGTPPAPWPKRQEAMLAKCRAMRRFGAARRDGSAALWRRRTAVTSSWAVLSHSVGAAHSGLECGGDALDQQGGLVTDQAEVAAGAG